MLQAQGIGLRAQGAENSDQKSLLRIYVLYYVV